MAITIKDIAEHVGVSSMAVSYALRNKGSIGAETRNRVLRAAKELGYMPNLSARAMALGKFGTVALIQSSLPYRSTLAEGMLKGIHDELTCHDMHLSMDIIPDEKLTSEGFVPKILRELMVDGLLINYTALIPQQMLELIAKSNIPAIWMNSKQESDCVYPDECDAGREATEYLLKLGHRRIAYANYSGGGHYSAIDRMAGYKQAMEQFGLSPRVVTPSDCGVEPLADGSISREQRPAVAKAMLAGPDRPSAVVTYSGSTAYPLLYAAASMGINVPGDLSVVTFHDEIGSGLGVPITTLLIPVYEVGRIAAEMIIEKIGDPSCVLPSRSVKFGFGEGQTCAPPPAAD